MFDQLPFAVRWQGGENLFEVEHPRGDQRLFASVAIGPQGIEVRQVRHGVDQAARAVPLPAEADSHGQQDEQARCNIGEDQSRFEEAGNDQHRGDAAGQDQPALAASLTARGEARRADGEQE